jgi:flavin reductase ActVB
MNARLPDDRDPEIVLIDQFRQAMASFPSGVVIATTLADDGRPWGFTASAFCSVSVQPPLVLVCLAKSADCHRAFTDASRLAISVLHGGQRELAVRFATKGADKFAGQELVANAQGIPVPSTAAVALDCSVHARYAAGDHTVLVARVHAVQLTDESPALYYRRDFHTVTAGRSDSIVH